MVINFSPFLSEQIMLNSLKWFMNFDYFHYYDKKVNMAIISLLVIIESHIMLAIFIT